MNPKLNKDHWIVSLSVVLTMALVYGLKGAFATLLHLWRLFLHVFFYHLGPGKITFPEKSHHSISWSNVWLPFAVSNPIFAAKDRLTHAEARRVVEQLSEFGKHNPTAYEQWGKFGPCDTLSWNRVPYRPWRAPALNLRRRPDDVELRSEVQWQPQVGLKLGWHS